MPQMRRRAQRRASLVPAQTPPAVKKALPEIPLQFGALKICDFFSPHDSRAEEAKLFIPYRFLCGLPLSARVQLFDASHSDRLPGFQSGHECGAFAKAQPGLLKCSRGHFLPLLQGTPPATKSIQTGPLPDLYCTANATQNPQTKPNMPNTNERHTEKGLKSRPQEGRMCDTKNNCFLPHHLPDCAPRILTKEVVLASLTWR